MFSRRRADGLALRRALPERSLPALVAAMGFLAALALGAGVAARTLAERWAGGESAMVTVQVPDPDAPAANTPAPKTRAAAVQEALTHQPAFARIHMLDTTELDQLLRPWLGGDAHFALPLPAVIEATLASGGTIPDAVTRTLETQAPGTLIERNTVWSERLGALADSLQACAALAIVVVAAIVTLVLMIVTRAGLHARRRTIDIIHGLGATDSYIASRFARRTGVLSLIGGTIGAAAALPLLGILAHLAAPFVAAPVTAIDPGWSHAPWLTPVLDLPRALLLALACLPPGAAVIGWGTAQFTVRSWLRRLP
nr:FtsX-like permease family protein [Ameyamaea chiangmaiensis]